MEKVAIITGATGGLGSEVARRFASAGVRVVVNGRNEAKARELVRQINQESGQAIMHLADVRNYEQLKAMVEETVNKWSSVDVLVNCAGGSLSMLTHSQNKTIIEQSDEEWDMVLDVNLKGSFNCIRAVAPQMIKQKDGHIILVSSGSALRPAKQQSSYAAAKAGIFGLMKGAARELGEYNIKVNAVTPGMILHDNMDLGGYNADGYIAETMLGRTSNTQDFASFILFLSQKNNISGQTFNLDSRLLF